MNRNLRFALASSAFVAAVAFGAVGAPRTAFAAPEAPAGTHDHAEGHGHRGHHGHHGQALVQRALALTSLNNAQRAQIEALAQEQQASRVTVHAARAKVLTTLAGQVDKGAIDRAALAPSLKDETDAMVAARLRERSIEERLHTVLTAKQCEEVGGGKDFLRPAHAQADVRAKVEQHASRMVDHLEKKLPSASAEQRAHLAAKLRERAAK